MALTPEERRRQILHEMIAVLHRLERGEKDDVRRVELAHVLDLARSLLGDRFVRTLRPWP